MKTKTITFPAEAVIDLSSNHMRGVEQHVGDLIVFLDHVVYMRNTTDSNGLLHMYTGVDITVTKHWFDKAVEILSL